MIDSNQISFYLPRPCTLKNHHQLINVEGKCMHYARRVNKTYMITSDGNESYHIQESPYKYHVKKFDKESLNKEVSKMMKKVKNEMKNNKEIK